MEDSAGTTYEVQLMYQEYSKGLYVEQQTERRNISVFYLF